LLIEFGNSKANKLELNLGYFEAKESDNIWLRYLTPYKEYIKALFVKNFLLKQPESARIFIRTDFSFPTFLIDSYEKYPESVVSGLTKIGGILALVKIVNFALIFLHRYLFEAQIKKKFSLKEEEGEDDLENYS
jgi:hypothetical protein